MTRDHPAPLAGAALALVGALAFWPVASGARSFFQMDLRYSGSIWHAVQQALRSGESPFWIDGQYCGNPLLSHQEAPPFYPLTAALLLTDAPAHRASDLFRSFISGWRGSPPFFSCAASGASSPPRSSGAWLGCSRHAWLQSAIWPRRRRRRGLASFGAARDLPDRLRAAPLRRDRRNFCRSIRPISCSSAAVLLLAWKRSSPTVSKASPSALVPMWPTLMSAVRAKC